MTYYTYHAHTYIGRPPDNLVIVSKIYAGIKWTKIAEILNNKIDGKNLRCGYQTALFSGNSCKKLLISVSIILYRKGLHVLDVQ